MRFVSLITLIPSLFIFAIFFYMMVIEPVFDPAVVCAHDGNIWNGKTEMCIDKDRTEYEIKIIQRSTHAT